MPAVAPSEPFLQTLLCRALFLLRRIPRRIQILQRILRRIQAAIVVYHLPRAGHRRNRRNEGPQRRIVIARVVLPQASRVGRLTREGAIRLAFIGRGVNEVLPRRSPCGWKRPLPRLNQLRWQRTGGVQDGATGGSTISISTCSPKWTTSWSRRGRTGTSGRKMGRRRTDCLPAVQLAQRLIMSPLPSGDFPTPELSLSFEVSTLAIAPTPRRLVISPWC